MAKLTNTEIATLEHLASHGNQMADALVKLFKARPNSATLSVAAVASGHIDTTIQLLDMEGKKLSFSTVIRVWVSDTAGGGPTAQSSLTTTVTTGTQIVALTANKVVEVLTDTAGKAVVRIADTGKSYYLNTDVAGLRSSAVITLP